MWRLKMLLFGDELVAWSVARANDNAAGKTFERQEPCLRCKKDKWSRRHGIKEEYRSQYNPGEYVVWTCVGCGFSEEFPC